jgi:hypothetical protein
MSVTDDHRNDSLENLRQLRASADPRWANSAISSLVSPFLGLLDEG